MIVWQQCDAVLIPSPPMGCGVLSVLKTFAPGGTPIATDVGSIVDFIPDPTVKANFVELAKDARVEPVADLVVDEYVASELPFKLPSDLNVVLSSATKSSDFNGIKICGVHEEKIDLDGLIKTLEEVSHFEGPKLMGATYVTLITKLISAESMVFEFSSRLGDGIKETITELAKDLSDGIAVKPSDSAITIQSERTVFAASLMRLTLVRTKRATFEWRWPLSQEAQEVDGEKGASPVDRTVSGHVKLAVGTNDPDSSLLPFLRVALSSDDLLYKHLPEEQQPYWLDVVGRSPARVFAQGTA